MVRKDKNVTASALFGVAAIQIVIGGIGWILRGGLAANYSVIDCFIIFSGPIYIVLGIVARRHRLPAAIIGSVLYACVALPSLGLFAFLNPVVILLLVAMVSALNHPAAKT